MARPGKKPDNDSPEEFMERLVAELQQKAREPDLHGYKPLPHQVQFHSSKETGRLAIGGNRSGKSYSNVIEMIWWALGIHPYQETPAPPVRLRHVAVDRPNGVESILFNLYKRLCPLEVLKFKTFEESWRREPPTLYFKNGSFIEFRSYEQDTDKHAGTSLHAIAFDEEPDQAIFNENMMRLVDTSGKWWCAMTPIEGMSWVFTDIWTPIQDFSEDLAIELFVFPSKDNTYLDQGAQERLSRTFSDEERKVRSEGTFIGLSSLILPFDHKRHVQPVKFIQELPMFCCMDSGLRNPTAFLWIQIDNDGVYYVKPEHFKADMLVEDHAKVVKQIEVSNGLYPVYRVGDPSIAQRSVQTGQSVQSIYAENGIHIGLGSNDVDAGIQRMAALFQENRIIVDPACTNLIRELKLYRWADWGSKKATMNKELKNRPKKKDDHAVDALRYGIMSRPYEDNATIFAQFEDVQEHPAFSMFEHSTSSPLPSSSFSYNEFSATHSAFYDPELGSDY